jgi:hypothetical protein
MRLVTPTDVEALEKVRGTCNNTFLALNATGLTACNWSDVDYREHVVGFDSFLWTVKAVVAL